MVLTNHARVTSPLELLERSPVMSAVVVKSLSDLIVAVPHMLGYRPEGSVVVVCVAAGRVALVGRVDPPRESDPDEVLWSLVVNVRKVAPEITLVMGYGSVTGEAVGRVSSFLAVELGIVTSELLVTGTHWRHLVCECCPAEGVGLPGEGSPVALALRVETGTVPAASREELEARVSEGARAGEVDPECERLAVEGVDDADAVSAWASVLAGDLPVSGLGREVLARAAVSVTEDVDLRDLLLALLCPGTLPLAVLPAERVEVARRVITVPWESGRPSSEQGARVLARLSEVCAALRGRYAVQPLTMLGVFAWWAGEGTVANVALERVDGIDPSCLLARAVGRMLLLGMRP